MTDSATGPMPADGTFAKISEERCRELLSIAVIGRVAFNSAHGLQLIPVNFYYLDGCIYFRVDRDSVLGVLGGGDDDVAFQTDHHEDLYRQAWSVLVKGRVDAVSQDEEIALLEERRQLQPWAVGDRNLFLRLTPRTISGRKVVRHAR